MYAPALTLALAGLYVAARLNGSTVRAAAHLTAMALIAGLALSA